MSDDLDIYKSIRKKYGNEVVTSGKSLVEQKEEIVSISPALDLITGGIVCGNIVLLSGPEKGGKTVTSLCIGRNAQKTLGSKVIILNVENRLKPRDLQGIRGLNIDNVEVIGSYMDENTKKGKIVQAAEYLTIGYEILSSVPKCVLIIDSIAQLLSESEATSDIDEQKRAPIQVLLARFFKQAVPILHINKSILICITHLIANVSGFGASFNESGGTKVKYASDVRLRIKNSTYWKAKSSDDNPIGQTVTWQCSSTSTAVCPGRKIDSYIRYGTGIDSTMELMQIGMEFGVIIKSGSWYSYNDFKCQGQEELYEKLEKTPELKLKLYKQIKELL